MYVYGTDKDKLWIKNDRSRSKDEKLDKEMGITLDKNTLLRAS